MATTKSVVLLLGCQPTQARQTTTKLQLLTACTLSIQSRKDCCSLHCDIKAKLFSKSSSLVSDGFVGVSLLRTDCGVGVFVSRVAAIRGAHMNQSCLPQVLVTAKGLEQGSTNDLPHPNLLLAENRSCHTKPKLHLNCSTPCNQKSTRRIASSMTVCSLNFSTPQISAIIVHTMTTGAVI
jgi:hypothetical protein